MKYKDQVKDSQIVETAITPVSRSHRWELTFFFYNILIELVMNTALDKDWPCSKLAADQNVKCQVEIHKESYKYPEQHVIDHLTRF